MFFLQLSQFKHWLLHGPTEAEQERISRTLAGMHWSVRVSYEDGRPIEVQWNDCGFEQASMCLLPDEPTTSFAYARPEDHRDPVPADIRFLRACGVRPPDVRDDLKMLDH